MHTHTYTHTHKHTHIHTHTNSHTRAHIHTHTHIYAHTYTQTHTRAHIHTHTYTHICTHTHMHTCTQTFDCTRMRIWLLTGSRNAGKSTVLGHLLDKMGSLEHYKTVRAEQDASDAGQRDAAYAWVCLCLAISFFMNISGISRCERFEEEPVVIACSLSLV